MTAVTAHAFETIRERVVRVRRRIDPTGPRCPEWCHGWCQHPLGHAGPHKWGDR